MTEEFVDQFALLVEKTKKHLKKHPNMNVADFANGFLFALLAEMRNETAELRGDVDEIYDSIEMPEDPFLDEVESVLVSLGAFVDKLLVKAGYLTKEGFTDTFPADLREEFAALGQQMRGVHERIKDAREDTDEEEEEDEADEEAEEDGEDEALAEVSNA